jgi:2'-5' RNA ligase
MDLDKEQRNISLTAQHGAAHRNPRGSMKYFLPYVLRRKSGIFQEIVIPDDVKVAINEPKEELNPELWEGEKLKTEIRYHLLKIAKSFYDFLKLDAKLKDVFFTGSMANFNWTTKSDIDLHLILDLDSMEEPREFVEEYIFAKKSVWNDWRNITIKGFDVELFAKDKENLYSSKGVYSVLRDGWVQKPKKEDVEIDEIAVKEKAANIMNKIDDIIEIKDEKEKVQQADVLKEKVRKMRDGGLEKGGEYSTENLVYKVLRKNGYMDKLFSARDEAFDNYLSLDETMCESLKNSKSLLTEGKKEEPKKFGCLMLEFDNISNWEDVLNTVKKEDIYDKPGFRLEEDPHTTVLFGFHDKEVSLDEIQNVLRKYLNGKDKIEVKLTGMSLFENEKFDVLKFDIESEDLKNLNSLLKEFPNTNDHPEYHPHATVAYLLPGTGQKYVKKFKKPMVLRSGKFKYSYPPNEKVIFTTEDLSMVTLGIQKGIKGMTPKKIELIKKFIIFVINRLELKEPISVYLHKGRDEYIVTTASYAPDENSNHVRVEGRALVDIMRSIGHELTHNKQREIESFQVGGEVQNIGGWIEDEANAKAGILIKDFALNLGNDVIYEL